MKNTEAHEITKADPSSDWTYCTKCGRDISADGSIHYRTRQATIDKRMSERTGR